MPEPTFDDLLPSPAGPAAAPRVGPRHRAPGRLAVVTRTIRQHWAAMWDRDTPPTVYSGAALLARRIRKAGQ